MCKVMNYRIIYIYNRKILEISQINKPKLIYLLSKHKKKLKNLRIDIK